MMFDFRFLPDLRAPTGVTSTSSCGGGGFNFSAVFRFAADFGVRGWGDFSRGGVLALLFRKDLLLGAGLFAVFPSAWGCDSTSDDSGVESPVRSTLIMGLLLPSLSSTAEAFDPSDEQSIDTIRRVETDDRREEEIEEKLPMLSVGELETVLTIPFALCHGSLGFSAPQEIESSSTFDFDFRVLLGIVCSMLEAQHSANDLSCGGGGNGRQVVLGW
mmetsp:Transcript_29147/g.44071  ORF Transcript_29147/g.44071 Transcript_29147/m.44071 type:complete len:216 (-) Transcript_29147:9-656(-)